MRTAHPMGEIMLTRDGSCGKKLDISFWSQCLDIRSQVISISYPKESENHGSRPKTKKKRFLLYRN